eukprot:Trichotokara_eunicae@DN6095_c0_g1_i1.p1
MACCGSSSVKNDKFSTFADAAYNGNVEKMKEQLKKEGKNTVNTVNRTDEDGMTPMHRAAQKGEISAIKFLIEQSADPRVKSKSGETPLHVAVFHRNQQAVTELLKTMAKADVDVQDNQHGMTPLHVAVQRGAPEIAKMLLDAGADPSIKTQAQEDAYSMSEFWKQQEENNLGSPTAKHRATFDVVQRVA